MCAYSVVGISRGLVFGSWSLISGCMYRWDIIHTHFLDGAKTQNGHSMGRCYVLVGDDIVALQIKPRNIIDIYSAMFLFLFF